MDKTYVGPQADADVGPISLPPSARSRLSVGVLALYFCSYGLPPRHAAFRTFMNEYYYEWTHNSKRLQSPLSNVCGHYCIAYILLRCNGFPMRTFINIFGTDLVAITIAAYSIGLNSCDKVDCTIVHRTSIEPCMLLLPV